MKREIAEKRRTRQDETLMKFFNLFDINNL